MGVVGSTGPRGGLAVPVCMGLALAHAQHSRVLLPPAPSGPVPSPACFPLLFVPALLDT